jgi:hypothetical protein
MPIVGTSRALEAQTSRKFSHDYAVKYSVIFSKKPVPNAVHPLD